MQPDLHPETLSFFEPHHNSFVFPYGSNDFEHFSPSFHRIPVTEAVWIAGDPATAVHIFLCGSAMDALAWANFNRSWINNINSVAFVATGAQPSKVQLSHLPDRTFHLIFANDHLGAACDLKIAAWLRHLPLRISFADQHFIVRFRSINYYLEHLSINALEKASGYRFHIKTHKPRHGTTFTKQLIRRHPP